jgi:hypothetical protein
MPIAPDEGEIDHKSNPTGTIAIFGAQYRHEYVE